MPKEDKVAATGVDVQILYPQPDLPNSANGSNSPAPLPNGGGYIMTGGSSNQPIIFVPGPTPAQPSVVVLSVGPKKDEEKKEKKSSSVFERL